MKKVLLTAGAAVAAAPAVFAATPDPASVVTTATTAFEAVAMPASSLYFVSLSQSESNCI